MTRMLGIWLLGSILAIALATTACAGSAPPAPAPTQKAAQPAAPTAAAPAPAAPTAAAPAPAAPTKAAASPAATSKPAAAQTFAVPAKDLKLRLAYTFPTTHLYGKLTQEFKQRVQQRSQGKIAVDLFPDGNPYADKDMIPAVLNGNLEIGLTTASQLGSIVPAAGVLDLLFAFKNWSSSWSFIQGDGGGELARQAEEKGVKVLRWWSLDATGALASRSTLIRQPEDLKGMKVRVYGGPVQVEGIKATGAAPTFISSSELYLALQRGTVDVALSAIPALISRKQYEVAPKLTATVTGWNVQPVLTNRAYWNSLPADARAILEATLAELSEESYKVSQEEYQGSQGPIETWRKQKGTEVYVPTPADNQKWSDVIGAASRKTYLQQEGQRAQRMLDLIEKYNKS